MQKLTRNILNNKLNKFRCNFTIEYSETIKTPNFYMLLTDIIPYNKQPS